MFSSANENNVGFSPIGNDELENVNAGVLPGGCVIVTFPKPKNK
jgi:hypothetical protein